MASPRNLLCANCMSTLSFPIDQITHTMIHNPRTEILSATTVTGRKDTD